MIIELKGVEFENKGSELMLHALLERIALYWPEAEIALSPNKKSPYLLRASVCAWQKVSLRKLYLDLNSVSYYFPNILSNYLKKWGVVTEADVDVVLDASGFSYSDQWSPKMSIYHLLGELKRAKKHGKPYIFMPQAFGPFSNLKVREMIKRGFPDAALICAREEASYQYVKEITGELDRLVIFNDFTNLIAAEKIKLFPEKQVCIIPNKNMINPRNKHKKWVSSYKELVLNAISIYRELGYQPFFLNHEGNADLALINDINSSLEQALIVITEENPVKVKGYISASDGVLCSRYHGCISALSNGIACLGTSWSHKYEQLYRQYEADDFLLEPEITYEQLKSVITESFDFNSLKYEKINNQAALLKEQSEELWLTICNVINSR